MNTTIRTDELRAVRITPEQLEHIAISKSSTGNGIRAAIGCDLFDVVSLENQIDLFVDDEGGINGSPLNLPLTIIAHVLGTPTAIFGNAVALSVDNATGESISLTDDQVNRITGAIDHKPDPAIIDRLCETLAPLPHIVAMLRQL